MLPQTTLDKILDLGLSRGADFVEVFVEESETSNVDFLNQKIDRINSGNAFGVGIRLITGDESAYGYSSDAEEDVLLQLTANLAREAKRGGQVSPLQRQEVPDRHAVVIDPASVSKQERVELLRQLDRLTRQHGDAIRQVGAGAAEKKRAILIANSEGLYLEDSRHYSRLRLSAIAEQEDGPQSAAESPGVVGGYEFFQDLDLDIIARETGQRAIRMAGAGYIEGGVMPVILGNGFGGVIFHEACGHPLETEAVRKNASPFASKIGEQIAHSVLTAIDDGTLNHHWGSINVDDEGRPAQRTVLIENGVLKTFMSDRIGARQVGVPASGSGRRESYKFAPVSRMRNTYIDRDPHSFEEMVTSIDYGLYAKKMGGGSVNPATGEFNFSVQEGYVIRNGKIAEPVRGATLIGKGHEVLPRISMVGDDLELAAGMCGASSGWVPTTIGQPTLKVDSVLVGGAIMDQQGAVEFVLGLAQEHQEADVDLVLQRGENLTLRVFNGQVEKIDQATSLGLGIRVVRDGRTGIAYTERLAPEAVERAFVSARENALLNDPTEVVLPSAPGEVPDPETLGLYNPELEAVTVRELETCGLEIEAAARAADTRVTSVPGLVVSRSNSEYRVVSTHGVVYYQRQNAVGASCQVLLEDQGSRKSGGYGWSQREWNPARSREIGALAVAKGADLLHAAPIPGG